MFIRPLEGKNKGTAGFFGWLAGMFGRVDKKWGVGLVKMLTVRGVSKGKACPFKKRPPTVPVDGLF